MNICLTSPYKLVAKLKPGECITISRRELDVITPYKYNDVVFTSADRILENIIGSAYEFSYVYDPRTRAITFCRLKQPFTDGSRTYTSPDRRKLL